MERNARMIAYRRQPANEMDGSPTNAITAAVLRRGGMGWFAVFFFAALLPRLSPIAAGAVFADDLIHLPAGHLLSHRFLNTVELFVWREILGNDYLITRAPAFIGSLYSAALCATLRSTLIHWRVRPSVAGMACVLIPLHPIWNTFIAWHVTAVYVLSLLLIVVGYRWLSINEDRGWTPAAIVLIAAGISGYQVHTGLLPVLVLVEVSLDPTKRRWPVVAHRVCCCVAAALLYLLASKIATAAGITTWGGRGFADPVLVASQLRSAVHAVTDNMATITQPLLSFYFGVTAAWRLWPIAFVALSVCSALALGLRRGALIAVSPIILPLLAASVLFASNVAPTGPRVASAIWIATVLSAVPLLQAIENRSQALVCALVGLVAVAMLPVTVADAQNRTRASEADGQTLSGISSYWHSAGVPRSGVTIAIRRASTPAAWPTSWRSRPIVMQNFNTVTPFDYSNARLAPEWLFGRAGFAVAVEKGAPVALAAHGKSAVAEWTHDPNRRRTVFTIYARPR